MCIAANNGYLKVKTPLLEYIEQKKAEKLRSKEEKREERRRKEFERKKAKEEEKRKKKEVKDHKDMKKKDDQKEDVSGVISPAGSSQRTPLERTDAASPPRLSLKMEVVNSFSKGVLSM